MKLLFYIRIIYILYRIKELKRLKFILNHFSSLKIINGRLLLYRGSLIPANGNPIKEHIGLHWTFDKAVASPYGAKCVVKQYCIYTAYIPFKSINWIKTVRKALWCFPREKEIELRFGREINLIAVDTIDILECYRDPITQKWQFPTNVVIQEFDVNCKG